MPRRKLSCAICGSAYASRYRGTHPRCQSCRDTAALVPALVVKSIETHYSGSQASQDSSIPDSAADLFTKKLEAENQALWESRQVAIQELKKLKAEIQDLQEHIKVQNGRSSNTAELLAGSSAAPPEGKQTTRSKRVREPRLQCTICQMVYHTRYRGTNPRCQACRDVALAEAPAAEAASARTVLDETMAELRPASLSLEGELVTPRPRRSVVNAPPPSPALTALVLNYSPSPRPHASTWRPGPDGAVLISSRGAVLAESPRRQVVAHSPGRFQSLPSGLYLDDHT